ncbi:MAG: hypothetical protein ACKOEW_11615 [Methylocystis sp.]
MQQIKEKFFPLAIWLGFVALAFASATEIRSINKPELHSYTPTHHNRG